MKSLLMTAAMSGLLAGATTTLSATTANSGANSLTRALGQSASFDDTKTEKHACKGQNSCKGKGGCKAGDNGCKGQNSCKGKGGCATDGSKLKAA
jgi:hypothetical protein